jgi:hypothetical protein
LQNNILLPDQVVEGLTQGRVRSLYTRRLTHSSGAKDTNQLAVADYSCNGDPLVDGRGGLGRMRGSMDVVDAEWLQGNEVAIVGLKRECIIFGIDEHYSLS